MLVELSEQEAQAVVDMIDLATKSPAGGLRVARAAVVISEKIAQAAQSNGEAVAEEAEKKDG